MSLTLGSLFDGIGGFPLAGALAGIKTLWAAEIEPSCIAVTRNHFPRVEHLGSVTDIDGAKIPPVDIITFGSPCQDLSVAGKQAGLDGKRSGLFNEAIRIIYEMRKATNGRYPTFAIWENVPGAFNSNKGHDFLQVLRQITKADIPMPECGKWAKSGMVQCGGVQVAWRQLDAQYWGVPQRRKRIFLVADFGGFRAEQILFKPESLPWNFKKGGTPRERTSTNAETSTFIRCYDARGNGGETAPTMTGNHNSRTNDYCAVAVYGFSGQNSITAANVGMRENLSPTITRNKQADVLYAAGFIDGAPAESYDIGFEEQKAPTLRASMIPAVLNMAVFDETMITSPQNRSNPRPNNPCHPLAASARPPVLCIQGKAIGRADKNAPNGSGINKDKSFTLNTVDKHAVIYAIDRAGFNQGINARYDFEITDNGINSTLVAKGPSAVAYEIEKWIVRRLTPLECERLQGFPDHWTETPKIKSLSNDEYKFWLGVYERDKSIRGKKYKIPTKEQLIKWYNKLDCDGNRYEMLGNSVAIPCVFYILNNIAKKGI